MSGSTPNAKKFCPKCGEENALQAKFCIECGTTFPLSDGFDLTPAKPSGTVEYDNQPAKGVPEIKPALGPATYIPNPEHTDQNIKKQAKDFYSKYNSSPPPTWQYVCTVCVPFVGIILYFTYREDHPDEARSLLALGIAMLVLTGIFNLPFGFFLW